MPAFCRSPPAHEGHEHFSAGEPGDPKKPARTVQVSMREDGKKMLYEPAVIEVRRGEQIRFVISNDGILQSRIHAGDRSGEPQARRADEEISRHGARGSERHTVAPYVAASCCGNSPSGASSNSPA